MYEREVVITGAGLATPLGRNVGENWNGVRAMKTGIACSGKNDEPEFLKYTGQVLHFDLPEDIPPRQRGQMKFLNRSALLGLSSTYEAISTVEDQILNVPPGRRALYVASGDFTKVGFDFMYPAIKDSVDDGWKSIDYEKLNTSALNKVNPFFLLESLHNNLFSFLSAYIEFMGPNTSMSTLSPCGSNALELAYRSIKQNNADVALAVGYGNWITEIPLYELEGLGILSKCRHGIHSYKPFDRNRDGFIPGEGGAAILLEDAEHASKRGSSILATFKGFGNCVEFTSNHTINVPPRVVKRNIMSVLEDADYDINDLAFVIPHGSGTKKGDGSELKSLMDIFNATGTDIPICGLKPYTGHMGAASDLAEIIYGINAINDKMVPATLNFTEAETDFVTLRISNSHQTTDKKRFLSISYGVGSQSSSVILEVNQSKY